MNRKLPVAAATLFAIVTSQAAFAQDAYGTAVTLGYNNYSGDSLDSDGGTIAVETEMAFGPTTLDLDFSYDRSMQDGDRLTNLSTEILPKYWFNQQVGAGVYFSRDSLDLDVGDVANLDSFGIEGTYRALGFEGSAFAGRTNLDDLSGESDVSDIGLRAQFDLSPQLSIYTNAVHSNFDITGDDFNANTLGIGGQYDFGNGLALFGGYQNASVEDVDGDLDTVSLGMNYGLDTVGMPVVLSGEYARINGDFMGESADADRLSLSATILLGNAESRRIPGNAVTSSILKSDRTAIGGTLSAIGF